MNRRPGLSARLKLTLSYAGFLLLVGALLLAVVWVFLLRYVPDGTTPGGPQGFRHGGRPRWCLPTVPPSSARSSPARPRR
ncbi:hypothetical protein ACFQHO_47245 [Actinomadura yumaensis]|uniref:hypothetical protein n=1 Tax=Actinomadura yumaensis TaxID=111807 RepID=UPI0036133C66